MTDEELIARLPNYRWYHVIKLSPMFPPRGVKHFAPNAAPVLRLMEKLSFTGKCVLDVGCRDGLFCFEAERRGAVEVLGIDSSLSIGAVELIIPHFQSKIEMGLYDLTTA